MACNNWEKLAKAQRDYQNPKFAISFVDKSLKKAPKNPFLLAWKADLSLQLNQEPKIVVTLLQQAWKQPGLTDTQLLSYMYRLLAEATRKQQDNGQHFSSVGNENEKVWQDAAKALGRKDERKELWSELGRVSLREECWEDFRKAVIQYNKESKDNAGSRSTKKRAHFMQVLATQLAAEQQRTFPDGGLKSQIQYDLARRLMKQAYEASPGDLIAFEDIRDLRFMGQIFARQGKCNELLELWRSPPAALESLMKTHRDDLMGLTTILLKQQEDWPLLEAHCRACVDDIILKITKDPESKCLWESCAWRIDMWTCLLQAVRANHDVEEGNGIVSDILHRTFGPEFQKQDRPLRLTYMTLRKFIGTSMLSDCKEYWEHHSALITCFADLRPFVQDLQGSDQREFYEFVRSHASATGQELGSNQCKTTEGDWHTTQRNVLKFSYHLTIALPPTPDGFSNPAAPMEAIFASVIDFGCLRKNKPSEGVIGIYTLLRMHHEAMGRDDDAAPNSRLLLQATMLARHLVACDQEKQDRPLALLAARLHLNLGLGQSAFQLYQHAKVKEMLVHTLSPYVLSRISITHPFDVKGREGFSAEEELEKALKTIERMDDKIEDNLYPKPDLNARRMKELTTPMESFPWDQAVDLLQNKRNFRLSLTNHICITERRRIARLKGDYIDHVPFLDYKTYHTLRDNVDTKVFPNYDSSQTMGPVPYIMTNMYPDVDWMIETYDTSEASSRVLYKESQTLESFDAWAQKAGLTPDHTQRSESRMSPAEIEISGLWKNISTIVQVLTLQEDTKGILPDALKALPDDMYAMRLAMGKLRVSDTANTKPEDLPTMFHENMLISSYTKLEVFRALYKLVEHLREKVDTAKSKHYMKAKLPKNWVNDIARETHTCYDAIRDVANSYITLIEEKGKAAIKDQIRWGATGETLRKVLTDDDVEFYATEYLTSARHAWMGVLQVKLK